MRMTWTLEQRDRFVARWLEARRRAGLSAEEMGRVLGISLRRVRSIEGKYLLPSDEIVRRYGEWEEREGEGRRRVLDLVLGMPR